MKLQRKWHKMNLIIHTVGTSNIVIVFHHILSRKNWVQLKIHWLMGALECWRFEYGNHLLPCRPLVVAIQPMYKRAFSSSSLYLSSFYPSTSTYSSSTTTNAKNMGGSTLLSKSKIWKLCDQNMPKNGSWNFNPSRTVRLHLVQKTYLVHGLCSKPTNNL